MPPFFLFCSFVVVAIGQHISLDPSSSWGNGWPGDRDEGNSVTRGTLLRRESNIPSSLVEVPVRQNRSSHNESAGLLQIRSHETGDPYVSEVDVGAGICPGTSAAECVTSRSGLWCEYLANQKFESCNLFCTRHGMTCTGEWSLMQDNTCSKADAQGDCEWPKEGHVCRCVTAQYFTELERQKQEKEAEERAWARAEKWDFSVTDRGDLMSVLKGPRTKSGKVEAYVFGQESAYTKAYLQVPTALTLTFDEDWSFLVTWKGDLLALHRGPKTESGRTEAHVLTSSSNYQCFSLREPTYFPISSGRQWSFLLTTPADDLMGIKRSWDGECGCVQVFMLSRETKWQQYLLATDTEILVEETTEIDFALYSSLDLMVIRKGPETESRKTEILMLTKMSEYKTLQHKKATPIGIAMTDRTWYYHMIQSKNNTLMAINDAFSSTSGKSEISQLKPDSNYAQVSSKRAMGIPFLHEVVEWSYVLMENADLMGIKRGPTDSGKIEFHLATVSSDYKYLHSKYTTPLSYMGDNSAFLCNGKDITVINGGPSTKSGKTEVSVLTYATNFEGFEFQDIATPLPLLDDSWHIIPTKGGNIMAINTGISKKTLSGKMEVHVLAKSKTFAETTLSIPIGLETKAGVWSFAVDGSGDLLAIQSSGTESGLTEVLVLSRTSRYSEVTHRFPTKLPSLTGGWTFILTKEDNLMAIEGGLTTQSASAELHVLEKRQKYNKMVKESFVPNFAISTLGVFSDWSYLFTQKGDILAVKKGPKSYSGKTEFAILDKASKYIQVSKSGVTALPYTHDGWKFLLKSNEDLVAIRKGIDNYELKVLLENSDYTEIGLDVKIALDPNKDWSFAITTLDDLVALNKGPITGSGRVEMTVFVSGSNYQKATQEKAPTGFDLDRNTDFFMDSKDRLIAISTGDTVSKRPEVRIANKGTDYKDIEIDGIVGGRAYSFDASWEYTINADGDVAAFAIRRGPRDSPSEKASTVVSASLVAQAARNSVNSSSDAWQKDRPRGRRGWNAEVKAVVASAEAEKEMRSRMNELLVIHNQENAVNNCFKIKLKIATFDSTFHVLGFDEEINLPGRV